jgi:hypothetical protein
MSKKTLIELIVIVLAFGFAAWILYRGFGGSSSSVSGPGGGQSGIVTNQPDVGATLLSNGDKLDFSVLDTPNLKFGQVTYPKAGLDDLSTGRSIDNLLKPLGP